MTLQLSIGPEMKPGGRYLGDTAAVNVCYSIEPCGRCQVLGLSHSPPEIHLFLSLTMTNLKDLASHAIIKDFRTKNCIA